ncbi:AraC family transcriptional regulator [Marinomonas rhizomae]|uniref:AraC-like DNA-binding protein n=1 Tax=Marinomonas rhizomae TaxID=491948 RepID=A0A366J9W7_9GAMM|nr:AraC family transcriptional regulator [Marinomonas rhizomae]RBP83742.1 AraC-like DNA-binding protein [Marinomonas rhizomae]RNF73541.1 AraC family transcriptional regulator [Marinomonas rhizomae]
MVFRVSKSALTGVTERQSGWQRQTISAELGECYVDRFIIEPGLSIAYSSYTPYQDLIEESTIEKDASTFSLTYGLEGHSRYQPKQTNAESLIFSPQHTTITTFGNSSGQRLYSANKTTSQLRILIDGSVFERYQIPFEFQAEKIPYPRQHRYTKTSKNTQHYVNRLLHLTLSGHTERPLEKNILVLNLLSEQLEQLQTNTTITHQKATMSPRDEHKVIQARLFMIQHMSQPLSIAFICQKIGLSESKLKQGFHAIYHTSPYKLLLEARMNKAWEMLTSGHQVAQTAYAVGYEHPSNFSAAFHRFHGCTPKSLSSSKRC